MIMIGKSGFLHCVLERIERSLAVFLCLKQRKFSFFFLFFKSFFKYKNVYFFPNFRFQF